MRVPVSVLIPAKNEQFHIADCVKSVSWADEVVVVDSQSTDQSVKLAEDLGARCVQFHYRAGGVKKKNWALENANLKHDWVLIVDADERIPKALADEIAQVVSENRPEAGYYINRRFYFLDRWIRHCGYYPSWNLRLFRRDLGRYELMPDFSGRAGDNEVHEHVVLRGKAGKLLAPMDHYAYLSIEQFMEKHARYADWEANLGKRVSASMQDPARNPLAASVNIRRSLKRLGRRLPFPHWFRFSYHYFLRLGFLDGVAGYILCHLLAEYEFLIWAKTRQLSRLPQEPLAKLYESREGQV
jgi:glycosyltransferase involved in cell wall biosynthesis